MIIRILLTTFAIFLLGVAQAAGRSRPFDVTVIRATRSFSFPIFDGRVNSVATTRINRLLQLSELQSLAKEKTRRIFDQVRVDDGSIYGGKVWMRSRIYSNNGQVLSVGFIESSCGMTCTYWNRYYNFNPGNGDRIALRDLFTENGYTRFMKMVVGKRSAKYRKEVRRKVLAADQESYLDTIGCFENDDLEDYYIQDRSIVIDGENCLIKGQKFDRLDMRNRIPFRDFRRNLNRYGRGVFGLDQIDLAKFRSDSLPQLFEGKVNESRIAVVLNHDIGNGIRGVYAYLKYGEGIGLDGSLIDRAASITEYTLSPTTEMKVYGPVRKYVETGRISGTLEGGRLEGLWTNKEGTETLPLIVTTR